MQVASKNVSLEGIQRGSHLDIVPRRSSHASGLRNWKIVNCYCFHSFTLWPLVLADMRNKFAIFLEKLFHFLLRFPSWKQERGSRDQEGRETHKVQQVHKIYKA